MVVDWTWWMADAVAPELRKLLPGRYFPMPVKRESRFSATLFIRSLSVLPPQVWWLGAGWFGGLKPILWRLSRGKRHGPNAGMC